MEATAFKEKEAFIMPNSDEFERVMFLFKENILVQLAALSKHTSTLEEKINSVDKKIVKLETTIEGGVAKDASDERHRIAARTDWFVVIAALIGSLMAGIIVHAWK